jgi:hypothetical protein
MSIDCTYILNLSLNKDLSFFLFLLQNMCPYRKEGYYFIYKWYWTLYSCLQQASLVGHKYSSSSILRYISYKTTFFKKIIVKSFLNGFWSFLHQKKQKYLKIICLFSVRLPLQNMCPYRKEGYYFIYKWYWTLYSCLQQASLVGWFGLWCLTPLSTIFQLYRGGQFYW